MHSIQNEFLKISIDPKGAELYSIESKKTGLEYLWQGDTNFWAGRSPILFPIVGGLKNNQYTYKNKNYTLPKHGFVKDNTAIEVLEKTATKIIFTLQSSPETLSQYPFDFVLQLTFELKKHKIVISYEVFNPNSTESMLFSIGGHPAFNCNLTDKTYGFETCYFEFEKPENFLTRTVNAQGLIAAPTKCIAKDSKILRLTKNIFDKDALIFENLRSQKVTLHNTKQGRLLRFDFTNFPYLAFWSQPGAPFVCIEPWYGIGDNYDSNGDFETKEGIQKLKPNKKFTAFYTIEFF